MVILSYRKDGIFEPDIPMLVVSTPLKNIYIYIEVSWDDYSQHMEK